MTEMLQMNGDNGPVTLTRVGDYAQLKIEIADGPVVNINMDPESCRALARVSLSIAGAIDAEARPRAPVQGDNHAHFRPGNPHRVKWAAENGREPMPPGTIDWAEHLEVWELYAKRYGRDQSAERMAQRGGFSYGELLMFLGHAPKTWRAR